MTAKSATGSDQSVTSPAALPRIYLSAPHIGENEHKFAAEVLQPGFVPPPAMHLEAFENEIAAYSKSFHAVALGSGTAGIHLALRLLGVGTGDAVFCSSFTFIASANPILYQGAKPVFIDSEPESWNMSPRALERALESAKKSGKLPKAVMIVNLYGQSADMDPLLELCSRYRVQAIEDAAESLGATYKGKPSGSLAPLGVFSFNGNKIITTFGGGMLVCRDPEQAQKARFWATQARDPAPHYQHTEMGYNYRMSPVSAGVGRAQLALLPERIQARRKVFAGYEKALGKLPWLSFMPEASFGTSTRWLTALSVDAKALKVSFSEMVTRLSAENIEARPLWKPLHIQPLFEGCESFNHSAEGSLCERLFDTGICLPSGSNLTENEQDRVISSFTRIYRELLK